MSSKKWTRLIRLRWSRCGKMTRSCSVCKAEISNDNFLWHMRTMHKGCIKCLRCTMKFYGSDREEKIERHMKEVHETPDDYRPDPDFVSFCKYKECHTYFISQAALKRHLAFQHDKYECPCCGKRINRNRMKKHEFDRIFGWNNSECDACWKKYRNGPHHTIKRCRRCPLDVYSGEMLAHRTRKYCKRCHDSFPCYGFYKLHLNDVCDPVRCLQCNHMDPFKNVDDFEKHMDEEHDIQFSGIEFKNKYWYCIPCCEYFPSEESVSDHLLEEPHGRITSSDTSPARVESYSGTWAIYSHVTSFDRPGINVNICLDDDDE